MDDNTMLSTDDSGDDSDGDDGLDDGRCAGDEGSSDDQADDGSDGSADDDSGGDGASAGSGTTDAVGYGAYLGSAGDAGDQGANSDASGGLPDYATDSMASGAGEFFRSAGNAVKDWAMGTQDYVHYQLSHVAEGVDGLLDDQQGVQREHETIQRLKQAADARNANFRKDVGLEDGERDPDPERTAGLAYAWDR